MASTAPSFVRMLVILAATVALLGCAFEPPVPPGGRSWSVSVVNRSSLPATLVVAEDVNGMGAVVGTATPNVVAPGTTTKVWFGLPPGQAWAIFVNPVPGGGPLLTLADLPSVDAIEVGPDGQPAWTSLR